MWSWLSLSAMEQFTHAVAGVSKSWILKGLTIGE